MTTVFLSGSRAINRLNEPIRGRMGNMVDKGFRIILGDANGADKAMQGYLADLGYGNVMVYCAGEKCRNNLGSWPIKRIQVDPKLKGRDFYARKDQEMAAHADYGFVLWDGKSAGSINNVFEMLKRDKSVVVYLSKNKTFTTVARSQQLNSLLDACNTADFQKIDKKINVSRHLKELDAFQQGALNL